MPLVRSSAVQPCLTSPCQRVTEQEHAVSANLCDAAPCRPCLHRINPCCSSHAGEWAGRAGRSVAGEPRLLARHVRVMQSCRVGIELDKVEVRFEDLRVKAFAESAGRTLPSIWNSYLNAAEVRLAHSAVHDICVIHPGRLPPCQWMPSPG